jgi:hypothetical protein
MQGMTPSAHRRHLIELERRAREQRDYAERNKLKHEAARHTMALWNMALAAGWRTIFYPSVGTALLTGCHWLHVVCPACQQTGETDLRSIDIHPNASVATVVRLMSCKRCSPHPPFARPVGATRRSWEGLAWRLPRKALDWQSIIERRDQEPGWAQNQIAARK